MKKSLFISLIMLFLFITACNNNSSKENSSTKENKDTAVNSNMNKSEASNADSKLTVSVKAIVDHYLHIKNELVKDDGGDAASGGKQMAAAMDKIDTTLFTTEQKKIYNDIADDLKEHAEHIGKNGGNIKHQREHFSMMSEDIYDLVKSFGTGLALYKDHCPMYDEGKGAIWLSEVKEIRNPYYGSEMPKCGSVKEELR
jgi:hypothetical protein